MSDLDFEKMLKELKAEWNVLDEERDTLEVRLGEVKAKLAHLNKAIPNIEKLSGELGYADDLSELGFTDAIRKVLRNGYPTSMTAQEIRKALVDGGFNIESYSSPMQSIYKILSRLFADTIVARAQTKDAITWQWILTDDDVPF